MNFLNKWIYGDLLLTNKYKYCFNFVEQFQGRVGHSSQRVAGKNNARQRAQLVLLPLFLEIFHSLLKPAISINCLVQCRPRQLLWADSTFGQ